MKKYEGVAALIYDILQDFIVAEIESAAKTNESIRNHTRYYLLFTLIVIGIATQLFSSEKYATIMRLEILSSQIAEGKLSPCVKPYVELDNLTLNLNSMAEKIKDLILKIFKNNKLSKSTNESTSGQITPPFIQYI